MSYLETIGEADFHTSVAPTITQKCPQAGANRGQGISINQPSEEIKKILLRSSH